MASSASLLGADGHSATLDRATAQFECSAAAQLSCANHSNTPAMSIGKSPSRWISDGQIFHEFSTVVCRPDDNPHVLPLPARQRSKLGAPFAAPLTTKPCDLEGERDEA